MSETKDRLMLLAHTSMESIAHVEAHEVAPSRRLRGEGAFPQARSRGEAPSPARLDRAIE